MRKAIGRLMTHDSASISRAVLLGDKYALSKSARHDFARTGTTFLIVVSGMHLSILCGFIAFLLKLMRVKRLFRAAAVAAIVIGFVFLTGFSRSVIRAGIMTVIACGGMVIHRKSDSLNSMGVAALALGKGAKAIHQSGRWYTDDNIDGLLMERHLAKKARRSGKHHLKGPAKRTEEDNRRFAESFERMITQAGEESK